MTCPICLEVLDESQEVIAHTSVSSSMFSTFTRLVFTPTPSPAMHAVHKFCLVRRASEDSSCSVCHKKFYLIDADNNSFAKKIIKQSIRIAIPCFTIAANLFTYHLLYDELINSSVSRANHFLQNSHNQSPQSYNEIMAEITSGTIKITSETIRNVALSTLSMPTLLHAIDELSQHVFHLNSFLPNLSETMYLTCLGNAISLAYMEEFRPSIYLGRHPAGCRI